MKVLTLCLLFAMSVGCGGAGRDLTREAASLSQRPAQPKKQLQAPSQRTFNSDETACRVEVPKPTEQVDAYLACLHARREARAAALAERQAKEQAEAEQLYEEGAAARQAERDRKAEEEEVRAAEAWAAKRKREEDEWAAKWAEEQAANEATVNAVKKRCGKDYGMVRVGMAWKRVRDCAGPFRIRIDDPELQVYEGVGGLVTVQDGIVRRVVRP